MNAQQQLYDACRQGNLEIARQLLKHGASINQAKDDGATPLYIACQNGHLEIARLLLVRKRQSTRPRTTAPPRFSSPATKAITTRCAW